MYSYVEGKLIEKKPTYVIIDVNGIGYQVHISLYTYAQVGKEENCKLYTHFVVREDVQLLYGFYSKNERKLFVNLISVSGVGANTARLILSSMNPDEVYSTIVGGNTAALQAVKGIGGKTAQRIIIDLKDKLERIEISSENVAFEHNTKKEEALSGLVVLGFNKNQASKAIDKILNLEKDDISVEELIKNVLKSL
ncbi:MAG: Holliday junction branch migration protein RuvA [Bacteroidetes bacterium]|nr:Holliday junction branch migration protein RuvA [Bacteroidota bacterium]